MYSNLARATRVGEHAAGLWISYLAARIPYSWKLFGEFPQLEASHIAAGLQLPGYVGLGESIHDKNPAIRYRGTGVTTAGRHRPHLTRGSLDEIQFDLLLPPDSIAATLSLPSPMFRRRK